MSKRPQSRIAQRMLETRSQAWRQAGLLRQINTRAVKRARLEALVLVPSFIAIVVLNSHRNSLLCSRSHKPPHDYVSCTAANWLQIATVIALLVLGWAIARDIGRAIGPALFRRMDPGTAGTVGFLTRLVTAGIALLIALNTAGADLRTLAVGGAFTAVIFGLAAQQTFGNVIAGTVLLSARPFRVGEKVRLQAGAVGGQVEGIVSSLGLLYTTLIPDDDDAVLVPNSLVLNAVVIPLRDPDSVDLRAKLRADITPGDLQALLEESLQTPLRSQPRITLEELDGDEVVVKVSATPQLAADGPELATELLEIISRETRSSDGADDAPPRDPDQTAVRPPSPPAPVAGPRPPASRRDDRSPDR